MDSTRANPHLAFGHPENEAHRIPRLLALGLSAGLPEIPYEMQSRSERFGAATKSGQAGGRSPHRIEALEVSCLKNLNETIDRVFDFLEASGRGELLEVLCPYFGVVWPSARALCERIVALGPERLAGRRVLEIGCGLALPSLLCARLGAQVVATDFHPEVPRFLRKNRALNVISEAALEYRAVDWEEEGTLARIPRAFDFVIGSDILYEAKHADLVARVIPLALAPGGTAILADPARPYLQRFSDAIAAAGFRVDTSVLTVADEPVAKDIFVLTMRLPTTQK